MKKLAILLFVGMTACAADRPAPKPAPVPVQAEAESLGCKAYKTYQTCNAAQGCMWAGLPLGCIKRVE